MSALPFLGSFWPVTVLLGAVAMFFFVLAGAEHIAESALL